MKIKLLLVDDEQDFIESLSERLLLRDFDVKTALNGDDGIKLVSNNDFDIIILDVKMPGKSGIDTLKEIKKINQLSQVIMLTGHATVESAIQGMKLGAYDYIMKPTDTEELIKLIGKAYKIVEEHRDRIRRAEIDNIVKKHGW